MARIVSAPTNLLVLLPTGAVSAFATGSNAGSFAGDTWTPGRDAKGVVNQASWDLVPTGRWVTVAGTRMDSLDADIKAKVPGWRDYGDWLNLSASWSGFAIDAIGNRVWFMGGGHSNSSNNGLYRFDAFKMNWAVEHYPSSVASWPASYSNSGSFTSYPDSAGAWAQKQAAGTLKAAGDVFYDELPDGKPTARHTYGTMVYAPEFNRLVMICRRLWQYNFEISNADGSKGSWDYKRLINDQAALYIDGEHGLSMYDEVRHEVLTSSSGSSGINRGLTYSLATATWAGWGNPWNRYGALADARSGRRVTVMAPPYNNDTGYGSQGEYWVYDLDTRAVVTSGKVQLAAGVSYADFVAASSGEDTASLVYLPRQDRYWLWMQKADRSIGAWEIDPTTTPWTLSRKTFTGAVPVPYGLMARKVVYFPGMNAVMLNDLATKEISLYKL